MNGNRALLTTLAGLLLESLAPGAEEGPADLEARYARVVAGGAQAAAARDSLVHDGRARALLLDDAIHSRERGALARELLVAQLLDRWERTAPWIGGVQARRRRPEPLVDPGLRIQCRIDPQEPLLLRELFWILEEDGEFAQPLVWFPGTQDLDRFVAPGRHPAQPASFWLPWQLRCNDLAWISLLRSRWIVPREWEATLLPDELPREEAALHRVLRDAERDLFVRALEALSQCDAPSVELEAVLLLEEVGLAVSPSGLAPSIDRYAELVRYERAWPFEDEIPVTALGRLVVSHRHAATGESLEGVGGGVLPRSQPDCAPTAGEPIQDRGDFDWSQVADETAPAPDPGRREAALRALTESGHETFVQGFLAERTAHPERGAALDRLLVETVAATMDELRSAGAVRELVRRSELPKSVAEPLAALLWDVGSATQPVTRLVDLSERGWCSPRSRP